MTNNKWTIQYGIHRGTLTSRDNGEPQQFDDKDQAQQWIIKERQWLNSIGYMFWYVYLISPDGNKQTVESNSYRTVKIGDEVKVISRHLSSWEWFNKTGKIVGVEDNNIYKVRFQNMIDFFLNEIDLEKVKND